MNQHTPDFSLPLPVYTAIPAGSVEGRDGDTFSLFVGLDEAMVRQLKEKSLDESDTDIQENTSDRKRFGEGSYEEWYAKSRVPFALTHAETGALAALVWFGPKPLGRKSVKHLSSEEQSVDERTLNSDEWHTLAYRAYPPFRGKGIMKAFVRQTMDIYKRHIPDAHFWAIVDARNEGSMALASKLGFTQLEEKSDDSSVVMVADA